MSVCFFGGSGFISFPSTLQCAYSAELGQTKLKQQKLKQHKPKPDVVHAKPSRYSRGSSDGFTPSPLKSNVYCDENTALPPPCGGCDGRSGRTWHLPAKKRQEATGGGRKDEPFQLDDASSPHGFNQSTDKHPCPVSPCHVDWLRATKFDPAQRKNTQLPDYLSMKYYFSPE